MRSFFRGTRLLTIFVGLLPWVAAFAVAVWVFQQHVPANGVRQIEIPLDGRSPWFEAFLPGQRASGIGPQDGGWTGQRITDEPVYARIRSPGAYDQLGWSLDFRPGQQPLIEAGTSNDAIDGNAEMLPVWSSALAQGFHPVQTTSVRGFVRDGLPDTALTQSTPETTLFWRATSTAIERMDTAPNPKSYAISLRGSHDFYVVPVNGQIQFSFSFQDSNRSQAGHEIALRLMRDQTMIWSEAIGTTGERALHPERVFQKNATFDHLAAGVYRLSVLADDGIFIRGFTTTARHWVLGPRVYFGDEIGYSTSTPSVIAWTNSRHIELKTLHAEGLQTVSLGKATVPVTQTHSAVPLSRLPEELAGDVLLRAPRGDIWLVGDGYLSFDRDALFLPYPRRLTDASDPWREGIQAVVTPYQPPENLGDGWYRTTQTASLSTLQERLRLVFAAPGIVARHAVVDVRALSLRFQRPPRTESWWSYLWRECKNAIHRSLP